MNIENCLIFFDKNCDGYISKSELIDLVEVLLDEKSLMKSADILQEFDFNNDNKIDFEEFLAFSKSYL